MQIFSNSSIYQPITFSYSQIWVYLSVSLFCGSQLFQNISLPFLSGGAALQSCCVSIFQGCFFCCTMRFFFSFLSQILFHVTCDPLLPLSWYTHLFRNSFDEFLGIFPKLLGQSSLGKPWPAG